MRRAQLKLSVGLMPIVYHKKIELSIKNLKILEFPLDILKKIEYNIDNLIILELLQYRLKGV